jgi:hypothetical protein
MGDMEPVFIRHIGYAVGDPWYHAAVRMNDAFSRSYAQFDWAAWAVEYDIENSLGASR